jgi:hypothetical protein
VQQPGDWDADHESPQDYVTIQSGPTAGAVFSPSPAGSIAHMTHAHHHTGQYDDPSDHRETSAHQHLDGREHLHEHVHDHRHGDHAGFPGGHSHPHAHVPSHDHYYRVADGSPIGARLVAGPSLVRGEYVTGEQFRTVGGEEGRGLSAEQVRSLGPYSRNPNGPADAGTPAEAAGSGSGPITGQDQLGAGNDGSQALDGIDLAAELRRIGSLLLALGGVRELDRDGRPASGQDLNGAGPDNVTTTGHVDVSVPADGWSGRAAEAAVVRAVTGAVAPVLAQLATLEQRLARIEAQPTSGGPQLRAADKSTPLTPAGQPGQSDQMRVLESLAGRISDPQAQVAVAAEMIRLQQEAAGMPPAFQVMPRAGGDPRGGWHRR